MNKNFQYTIAPLHNFITLPMWFIPGIFFQCNIAPRVFLDRCVRVRNVELLLLLLTCLLSAMSNQQNKNEYQIKILFKSNFYGILKYLNFNLKQWF